MHPSITSSQNAVELLSVHKTCVDGKKKDRDLLSEDVLVLGRLALLMSRAGEEICLFYCPENFVEYQSGKMDIELRTRR